MNNTGQEGVHSMRGTGFAPLVLLLMLSSCSGALFSHAKQDAAATAATTSSDERDRLTLENRQLRGEVNALQQAVNRLKQELAGSKIQQPADKKTEQPIHEDRLWHSISFHPGYVKLTPQSRRDLERLAAQFLSMPGKQTIDVRGYTDSTPVGGPPGHRHKPRHPYKTNMELSKARADAVASALIEAGVPQGMVHSEGFGASEKRRVEIHLVKN